MKQLSLAFVLALSSIGNAQALAPLPSSVTKIFEYSCQRRFFEGEGVRPNMISCTPYQHLGFYLVNNTFYLYQNSTQDNFFRQGRAAYFPGNICGMPQLDRYTCESSPRVSFGVSEFAEGPFVARVQLTASPEGFAEPVGFVALPDRVTGECEEGLEKSYVYAAKFGMFRTPLPTNIPSPEHMDNYSIRPAQHYTDSQDITRVPAQTPCDGRGFCRWPDGTPYVNASAYYAPVSNAFCVIPVNRIVR